MRLILVGLGALLLAGCAAVGGAAVGRVSDDGHFNGAYVGGSIGDTGAGGSGTPRP